MSEIKSIDKTKILNLLVKQIEADLHTATIAANISAAGATHVENKAESSKDTRATEASYLARGQSIRVAQLEAALVRLRFMELPTLNNGSPICTGGVVCLEDEQGKKRRHFLVTDAGGYTLDYNDLTITTITAQSPLGKELIEKIVGDEVELFLSGKSQLFEIINIQ